MEKYITFNQFLNEGQAEDNIFTQGKAKEEDYVKVVTQTLNDPERVNKFMDHVKTTFGADWWSGFKQGNAESIAKQVIEIEKGI